jgi:ParB family transcriptional regulator, chromosome partitioning protein
MKIVELPIEQLHEASWNPNEMDLAMTSRLRESICRYGLVENLVVRQISEGNYEVLSGNQRLGILREIGVRRVPCVVTDLDDVNARVLAQALNRIQGQDNPGLKAELLKKVLDTIPERNIMLILPETLNSLESLGNLGKVEIATYLEHWEYNRKSRLKHLQLQLTSEQLEIVQEAIGCFLDRAKKEGRSSPNVRGAAIYLLCRDYLEGKGQ